MSARRTAIPPALLRMVSTPLGVTLAALVVYAAFAVGLIAAHGVDSLPDVGRLMADKSSTSATLDSHLHPRSSSGYDGQFFLAIALDPAQARHYVDAPTYRYSHILYPILARAAALGRAGWVPYTLILVNLVAVGLGTFCIAVLLARNDSPTALAALYFMFPGLLAAFSEDLSEPLAYGLVALGLLLLSDWRGPRRVCGAAIVFALAALARESTLLIPLAIAAVYAAGGRRRLPRAAVFVAVTVGPYLAWRVILNAWLGSGTSHPGSNVGFLPYSGLIRASGQVALPVLGVAIPATTLAVLCLLRLRAEWRTETFAALCVSLVVLAFYLPAQSYIGYASAGRLQIGAVLLVLVSLRALNVGRGSRLVGVTATFAYLPLLPIVSNLISLGYAFKG